MNSFKQVISQAHSLTNSATPLKRKTLVVKRYLLKQERTIELQQKQQKEYTSKIIEKQLQDLKKDNEEYTCTFKPKITSFKFNKYDTNEVKIKLEQNVFDRLLKPNSNRKFQ